MSNPFEGLDLTGWLEEPRGFVARATTSGLILMLYPNARLEVWRGVFDPSHIECTDIPAAYELANAIAKATGGWKNAKEEQNETA